MAFPALYHITNIEIAQIVPYAFAGRQFRVKVDWGRTKKHERRVRVFVLLHHILNVHAGEPGVWLFNPLLGRARGERVVQQIAVLAVFLRDEQFAQPARFVFADAPSAGAEIPIFRSGCWSLLPHLGAGHSKPILILPALDWNSTCLD